MRKEDYRSFFASVKPFLKMAYFIRRADISKSAFSLFMRGPEHNYCLSIETLEKLYADISETVGKIA